MIYDTTTVKYARTPFRMRQQWAVPVLVGPLIPRTDEVRSYSFTGDHLLGQMVKSAMADSPALKAFGVTPQLLERGLELGDARKLSAIADPTNGVSRLRQTSVAVRHASDEAVRRLGKLVREGARCSTPARPAARRTTRP